jgi:hypothetical protein
MPEPRRFPPPWSVDDTEACFIVRDANGQALAYVYFEEEPARRSAAQVPYCCADAVVANSMPFRPRPDAVV